MYPNSTTANYQNITTSQNHSRFQTSILFSINDSMGSLKEYLSIISKHKLNVVRIESKPSKFEHKDYDFFLDLESDNDSMGEIENVIKELKNNNVEITVLTQKNQNNATIPWFPRKISDLDLYANKVMEMGSELSSDHPGATDPVYRERRKEITKIAANYKHGQEIPRITYTDLEIETWKRVYSKLKELFSTHACIQHTKIFPLLEQYCGYSENNIPQLQDISNFLSECTGFRIRPVQGLLSSRDFLNGLAFRVFHATQYVRHHSVPLYTPEPDVCHELLGHVPLFADPDFADFSQEIGLASIGASDEDIQRLSTCYWFTVEFGLCKEGSEGRITAYGAGLLSSTGELQYCLSDKPEKRPFNPFETCKQTYPITEFQPIYYVAESFQAAKEQMRKFAESFKKPFVIHYNAYTQSIEILDTRDKLLDLCNTIKSQTNSLADAIKTITLL